MLTFTVGLTDAEKAAYLCIEKVAGAVVPTAEKILAEGTAIAQAGEITADNLKEGTAYIIAVAASNKEVYSEVKSIEMSTDKDLSGPAVFDRQVAGRLLRPSPKAAATANTSSYGRRRNDRCRRRPRHRQRPAAP